MFVTLMSKNAFWPGRQKPRARISGRASSPVSPAICSPSRGWRGGSHSTSLQTCFRRLASKSRMLLCLIVTRPPLLQFMAWLISKACPQGHFDGRPRNLLLYRIDKASRNSPLLSVKPWSSSGNVLNQLETPFSFACLTAFLVVSSRGWKCNKKSIWIVARVLEQETIF